MGTISSTGHHFLLTNLIFRIILNCLFNGRLCKTCVKWPKSGSVPTCTCEAFINVNRRRVGG